MEPNIKEGVGGFRDANLVYWIGKILYNANNIKNLPADIVEEKEYRSFRIALEFMFRVRSALHLITHKKEDKLRLDLIPDTAYLLGYKKGKEGQTKFAQKVTESLKIIRLYSTIWVDRLTTGYQDEEKEKNFIYPKKKNQDFNALLRQLCIHAKKPFHAHPTFLQALISAQRPERLNATLYKTIYTIFEQPNSYAIFRTLSHVRLLKYTIPPIKKVVDLPQFDGYHQYAVDIHSIYCLYHLEHIEDSYIQKLFEALSDEEKVMLKLVTFLHDAGKGRKRDHHFVGATLFKIFAQKLDIDSSLIKMGETLITYHTLMSNVAQREDLYSEKVILGFASHFKSKKLLDMIYILTYADMSGVGGDIYNSFTAKLIKTLYTQSVEVLGCTDMLDEAARRAKKEQSIKNHMAFKALKKSEQKKIFLIPSNLLFLRYTPKRILAISQRAFETKTYEYHISNKKHLTIEIIRTRSFNLSYLLSKLSNLDVVNMDIYKLFDGLKYFKIDFSQNVTTEEIVFIEKFIHDSFNSTKRETMRIPKIQKNELDIDCEHTKTHAIMHLNSLNQKGLLAFIIDMFDEMGIDIVTAKIHTLKNRARDMFLIEKNGNFCHNVDIIIEKLTKG